MIKKCSSCNSVKLQLQCTEKTLCLRVSLIRILRVIFFNTGLRLVNKAHITSELLQLRDRTNCHCSNNDFSKSAAGISTQNQLYGSTAAGSKGGKGC